MRFLLDMGVSWRVAEWLRGLGHDAVHLLERGLARMADLDVAALAREERRILLTCDLGFGKLVRLATPAGPSVLLFRLSEEGADRIIACLPGILEPFAAELEQGAIVVVEDNRIRLHRLVIEA